MISIFAFFILFVGIAYSSLSSYEPFNPIHQLSNVENNIEPLKTSNHRALHSNRILDCDMEDIIETIGLNEIQVLIEAVALRKGSNPYAILRMLYKRMKNKEEIEDDIMNSIDAIPLPDLLSPPIIEAPPPARMPPVSSHTPYSLPSNDPMTTSDEEDTNFVIIPVAPDDPVPNGFPAIFPPMIKPDAKVRNEAPFIISNIAPPVGKMNHAIPDVFPVLSPIKANHLRPPLGATVRVDSGDSRNPINRDVSVTVSPLMTIIEALRQAEIKYQNVLGLNHDMDVITFTHSLTVDCYIVNRINDVVESEDSGWKITIVDRDGQIEYDGFCLPNGNDVLVKPGTLIFLSYVSL
ncbi:uncharacterized protein TNCT_521781 [Trichonephila clavata]|uniref:Uncharacterized protein n=1 Tax=Trichonephila clavata TaxID=2740835 RepID=A0A8X6HCD3_TRICU|nr:uncharacterized protein TNCT_521781 [Trichonephila clavata]